MRINSSKDGLMARRTFIQVTGIGALAAAALPPEPAIVHAAAGSPRIAFNTANLVARVTGETDAGTSHGVV